MTGSARRSFSISKQHHSLPDSVASIDCGTSIRDILFDIILVPAQTAPDHHRRRHRQPGSWRPGKSARSTSTRSGPRRRSDFSLHQFPTINMLKEIKEETPIDVRVFVAQVAGMPSEVKPGLSEPVQAAVPRRCATGSWRKSDQRQTQRRMA
ncbi:MAG: hypothetical protein MZV70_48475 [Desulfobacterales bacterium]|nr:hypothetical protein [Desulfobacterales bacterium]